ncbi:MAG: collagen-like protein [Candidatus Caenarcaniphilales bacterium]|nr:collagen-like protein [Candidatus Caenarcaniphilales bacterium]
MKISGANISPEQAQGFSRLLLRKSTAEDILLNGDLPANSNQILTNAPTIPAETDTGVNLQGAQGEQGPQGPAGLPGATGPQGPAGTLADGSVTTAKLASEAVTTEKVNSIASSKIAGLTPFAKASSTQIFDEEPSDEDNELDLTDINFIKVESLDPDIEIFGVKNAGVEGQRVLILFTGSNCVTVESDDSDATYEIILYEEDDFHFYPNDTLELVSDGTRWYEVSRSLNADP